MKIRKAESADVSSLSLLMNEGFGWGIIEDVVVFKKYIGKAVGVRIIEELIQLSKNKNCYKVILNTKEDNLSYYEKIGFTKKQLQMELRHR